jgi:hypothetical protein
MFEDTAAAASPPENDGFAAAQTPQLSSCASQLRVRSRADICDRCSSSDENFTILAW